MHVLTRGEGHASSVMYCLMDGRNDRFITISADKVIRCWNSATLRCIQVCSNNRQCKSRMMTYFRGEGSDCS